MHRMSVSMTNISKISIQKIKNHVVAISVRSTIAITPILQLSSISTIKSVYIFYRRVTVHLRKQKIQRIRTKLRKYAYQITTKMLGTLNWSNNFFIKLDPIVTHMDSSRRNIGGINRAKRSKLKLIQLSTISRGHGLWINSTNL